MPGPPPPPNKVGSLTDAELATFLTHPWNGRLATVTPEGSPYVVPVWYEYDPREGIFYIIGRARSAYVAHIRHCPSVAFHVADDVHREHTRVLVRGRADVLEGPVVPRSSPRLRAMVVDMSCRYLGPPGEAYAERTMDRPRYLIRITPERWQTWTGGEWAPRYRK